MNRLRSERRIKVNRIRRKHQIRKQIFICIFTLVLVAGLSFLFFGIKTKARSNSDEVLFKYFKSVQVEEGDSLWHYAELYADIHYVDNNEYIDEVKKANHLSDDNIMAGGYLILPYYSNEFI